MTRTVQPAIGDTAKAEIGLLMRTGALAGVDRLTILHDENTEASHVDANDRLFGQALA
jgi:hypothetical protein